MRKVMLLLLLLPACTLEQRGAPENDPDTQLVVGNGAAGDSVEAIISMPTYARVGDDVPITIVVRNAAHRPLELHLTGRETVFDIVLQRPDSAIVWQRLRDVTIPQILQLRPLAAGESFALADRWQALIPGEYLVSARIPTDTRPILATPVRLTVR